MQHTFLFCDIVGWTALTDELGDERGADIATGLIAEARRLLPAYGARCVKALGDGLMVRCENAAPAVRLGVRLVEQSGVALRVGIHTGPAVQRDGDWYGRTVNVAARLCDLAGGGDVLASGATIAAAGRLGGLERGPGCTHRLRNLREPVEAYVVRCPRLAARGRDSIANGTAPLAMVPAAGGRV